MTTNEILKPITGSTKGITTNYRVLDSSGSYQDLNEIFAPLSADLAFKTTYANSVAQYTIKNGLPNDYYLVTFTDTDNQGSIEFTSQNQVTVNYLIVGGGGGGGYSSVIGGAGAGGGGGSIITNKVNIPASTTIYITVGKGGNGGSYDGTTVTSPTSGSPSYISYNTTTITASGGYYGESVIDTTTPANGGNSSFNFTDASGGFGAIGIVNGISVEIPGGGAGPENPGVNGDGTSVYYPLYYTYLYSSGNGGDGYTAINFDLNTYGGGGGGGGSLLVSGSYSYGTVYGTGGKGGGGDGATVYFLPLTSGGYGTPNTGGGGGGGGSSNNGPELYYQGGDGGSGIVILKITL